MASSTKKTIRIPWRLVRRLAAIALLLAILAVLTLPYWMGILLNTVLPQDLVKYERYERIGYGRFSLKGVEVATPGASVAIDAVEVPSPLNWGYRGLIGGFEGPVLAIGEIRVEIFERAEAVEEEPPASGPQNLPEVLAMLETPIGMADSWMPKATIERIVVDAAGHRFVIEDLLWSERTLSLTGHHADFADKPGSVVAKVSESGVDLEAQLASHELTWILSLASESHSARMSSQLLFRENLLKLDALFGPDSWVPLEASWRADSWRVQAEDFGVQVPYSGYAFDFEGAWKEGAFSNRAAGTASTEQSSDWDLPEIAFDSNLNGDLSHVRLDGFDLKAPGFQASMHEPVSYDLEKRKLDGKVLFDIDLDLSILKVEDVAGELSGLAEVSADETNRFIGGFKLAGSAIQYQEFEIPNLNVDAEMDWPRLDIARMEIALNGDSKISLNGGLDFEQRTTQEIVAKGNLDSELLKLIVPAGMELGGAEFVVQSSGAWGTGMHSGTLNAQGFEQELLKPLDLSIRWSGAGSRISEINVDASNGEADFVSKLNGSYSENVARIDIEQLELRSESEVVFGLSAPASVEAMLGDTIDVALGGFALSGSAGSIELDAKVTYPSKAEMESSIEMLDIGRLADSWLKEPIPAVFVRMADFEARWEDGPVLSQGSWDAQVDLSGSELDLAGTIETRARETVLEDLVISDSNGDWVTLNGKVPYSVSTTTESVLNAFPDGGLDLDFKAGDNPSLLNLVSEYLPFQVAELHSEATLSGTLNKPIGRIVSKLLTQSGEGENALPAASIDFQSSFEGAFLHFDSIDIKTRDEAFSLSGSVALPEDALNYLKGESPEVDWAQTEFSVEIPNSSVTPLAYFAPQLLSPGGTMEAKLSGNLDGGINGFLRMNSLNTRPIFPFGALRNIESDLMFAGHKATLANFAGDVGREPLTMGGFIDYQVLANPRFELSVLGKDLPLLRQAGLLLRADLDLKIGNQKDEVATISGLVTPKDGLFLLDTSVLAGGSAGGGKSADARPPYFSVDVPPLDKWKLDLQVKGERFIRLQTPAATGVLSMDLKLQGALAEPFAYGRVEFDEGDLLFPFASFGIEQGLIEMRIDDPYTPLLEIQGMARRFGYDLGVEITGSAFDPQIRFSSSPPLNSEQILMMVMAGENPDGMFDYSASQRASKIGSYIGKGLFASGGSSSGIGSRFSLTSGENLSRQGKETMEIEFKLDEKFQLLGEYDEYDSWNAGVRWKIMRRTRNDDDAEGGDDE